MPKVNVYLPDDLAEAVRATGVPISKVCQRALAQAVRDVGDARTVLGIPPTFERFTARARLVVSLASGYAAADDVDLGSEHVLRGLMNEGSGVATKALVALGVTDEAIVAATAERSSTADGPSVFLEALKEALKLGHNYIGTEHLLLGIASTDNTAKDALADLGVTASAVKREVISVLTNTHVPAKPAEPADVGAKLDEVLRRIEELEKRLPA
jgi:ATP-dependent Clp protease ATP-binding subunit ClpC